MSRILSAGPLALAVAVVAVAMSGCTSPKQYVANGFKVGPNYCPPPAPVARQWIDESDRIRRSSDDIASHWWDTFQDPVLRRLVVTAYCQNLTLREAGFRVLQARAQLAIVRGELFPQLQNATGSYRRTEVSLNPPSSGGGAARAFDQWAMGFNLAWELDFWGRFRRAITSADDQLQASVFDYDQVLVTLLGDIASNYVQIRTDQRRIYLLQKNIDLQRKLQEFTEARARRRADDLLRKDGTAGGKADDVGGVVSDLDLAQAASTLKQTEAGVPALLIDMRQAMDRLCILLGIPPMDLMDRAKAGELWIGAGPNIQPEVPRVPPIVVVGIPADLLRRRPDVRRAERLAAAQAELIGIAEAELYPIFTINGNLGWQARRLSHLFTEEAFTGSVGPSFQWNLLNYGRIINNVRFQDARFKELVVAYQNTVLQANQEVEDGLVTFLQAQDRAELLGKSTAFGDLAEKLIEKQAEVGRVDFNRYVVIAQNLVLQQDSWAQAQGQIAQGLIQVYRALGGGWQIRLAPPVPAVPAAPPMPPMPGAPPDPTRGAEVIPAPPEAIGQ